MIYLVLLLHLIIVIYELSKKSISVLLWAVLIVVFSLPHAIHTLDGEYPSFVLDEASMFALLFMVTYLIIRIIYHYRRRGAPTGFDLEAIREAPRSFVLFLFITYLIAFAVILVGFYARGGSLATAAAYQSISLSLPESIARWYFTALSGLGFVLVYRRRYVCGAIFIATVAFYLLITQIRYYMIGFVMPFMLYFLFSDNKRLVIRGIVVGLIFVFAVFLFQQFRWFGGLDNAMNAGFGALLNNTITYMRSGEGEMGLVKAFYYFIEERNDFQGFGDGLGFIRLGLIAIPSSIADFKPHDFAIDMYREWFRVDNPEGTMHPTLFGDAYANFGFGGWLTGAFYAVFAMFIDENYRNSRNGVVRILKMSLFSTAFIMLGRGAVYNAIFNVLLGWVLISFAEFVYLRWRRGAHEEHRPAEQL